MARCGHTRRIDRFDELSERRSRCRRRNSGHDVYDRHDVRDRRDEPGHHHCGYDADNRHRRDQPGHHHRGYDANDRRHRYDGVDAERDRCNARVVQRGHDLDDGERRLLLRGVRLALAALPLTHPAARATAPSSAVSW
jgi:hypothetical protein